MANSPSSTLGGCSITIFGQVEVVGAAQKIAHLLGQTAFERDDTRRPSNLLNKLVILAKRQRAARFDAGGSVPYDENSSLVSWSSDRRRDRDELRKA